MPLFALANEPTAPEEPARATLSDYIPLQLEGYADAPPGLAAGAPWPYRFPADYASHSDYPSELWQWFIDTVDEQGRRYGFMGRIARLAVRDKAADETDTDNWFFSDIYVSVQMAVEPAAEKSKSELAVVRGSLGLAGSTEQPMEVWVRAQEFSITRAEPCLVNMKLQALIDTRPLVLELGSSQCATPGVPAGSPSLYGFSQPVDAVSGHFGAVRITEGRGWLDRAWGQLPLGDGPVVVDQLRIHHADNAHILVFQTRRRSGRGQPQISAYRWSLPQTQMISLDKVELIPESHWVSPRSGKRYVSHWQLRLVDESIGEQRWRLMPRVPDQEVALPDQSRWLGVMDVERDGQKLQNAFAVADQAELPR